MKMKKTSTLFMYILPLVVMLFNVLIILFPKEIIGASKNGISLWFNNVLPSLLPFVIGTNLLIGLGFVSFIGTLVEPLMTKLFRVPGQGAFAWVLGMTSGYPIGAKITADLRTNKELTQAEAQRLISFTNNSGPLFVVGAVGTGMFGSATGGYFMLLIHYLAAFTVGLLFRNYKRHEPTKPHGHHRNILRKSFHSLRASRMKDDRTFGALLGDSVKNAMETMVVIGGFIILFCVVVEALEITNILGCLANLFKLLGERLGINENIYEGLVVGIMEITNGCKILGDSGGHAVVSIVAAAAVISWGGLSIHAQSIRFLAKTDIKIGLYLFSKLLHFFITILYGICLYRFFDFDKAAQAEVPAFSTNVFYRLMLSSREFLLVVGLIALFGLFVHVASKIKKPSLK